MIKSLLLTSVALYFACLKSLAVKVDLGPQNYWPCGSCNSAQCIAGKQEFLTFDGPTPYTEGENGRVASQFSSKKGVTAYTEQGTNDDHNDLQRLTFSAEVVKMNGCYVFALTDTSKKDSQPELAVHQMGEHGMDKYWGCQSAYELSQKTTKVQVYKIADGVCPPDLVHWNFGS